MHEMTIARQIVGIVEETLSTHPNTICTTVHIKIGEMRAIIPESLNFAYQAIIQGTRLSQSKLVITSVPVMARCHSCQKQMHIRDFEFLCSACHSQDLEIMEGRELHVEKLEVET